MLLSRAAILGNMASAAAAAPAPRTRTFATLLEEYAAPPKLPPARDPGSPRTGLRSRGDDLDGLEDDVATFSYEHTLQTHARYHREPEAAPGEIAAPKQEPLTPQAKPPVALSGISSAAEPTPPRKSTSVTVRLTPAESGQLRARAAEAGLTVSAYLRSCAFEVESLRVQVKEAVAQMKQSEGRGAEERASWLRRIFTRRQACA